VRVTTLRELNKMKLYTIEQLETWEKFKGKYLNVRPSHFTYWKDGRGYITVYEVRSMTDEIKENHLSVDEIRNR